MKHAWFFTVLAITPSLLILYGDATTQPREFFSMIIFPSVLMFFSVVVTGYIVWGEIVKPS